MLVELKSVVGEATIKACEEFGLVFKHNDKELIKADGNGNVLVNGNEATAEEIGLALMQWSKECGIIIRA